MKKIFSKIRAKNNKITELENKITSHEKALIAQSFLWDPLWYVKKYNHDFNREEALDYWYHKGWKEGENPSRYLNVKYFSHCDINPVIYYLNNSHSFIFPDNRNNFKSQDDDIKITKYLNQKTKRKARSVVYTCITNNYDDICELKTYKYLNHDWDYICYTDNKEHIALKQIGIWEIRPLQYSKLDNSRNNRWHKMHPHILFPEYDESIYLDANINILTSYIFDVIKEKDMNFILPRHFKSQCVYSEYKDVLALRLDSAENISSGFSFIKNDGMPKNYGFTENNVLYRRHNQGVVIEIMNEWWNLLKKYAKRDQLSLTYLFWKHSIKIEDVTFENIRYLINDFYMFDHKKEKKTY